MKKITVLLVEDHLVVRQALGALLTRDSECAVVGEALSGREAVVLAAKLRPDVILMDIGMPGLNGCVATRQIVAANPAAKVLVLSGHSDAASVGRMIEAGAAGFLEKQTSAAVLVEAVRDVAVGKAYFSPDITRRMAAATKRTLTRHGLSRPDRARLTPRELEVLQLVAEGHGNKQAALILRISVKTVAKHRQQLMDKLDIHETAGLTRYALLHGIIESGMEKNARGAG